MKASACGALGVAALIAATAHGATAGGPTIGKLVTVKDWAVGCDNGLSCQAVALIPEDRSDAVLSFVITRRAEILAPLSIEISGFTSKAERYRIMIDGRIANSGQVPADGEAIRVNGADAVKLARAMARGKSMRLVEIGGADLGTASLSGVTAALRHTDVQQGRAGSKGAVIARGKRKATARKAELPVITASRITPSDMLPDATALVALSESSPCAAERLGSTEDTAYSLGNGPNGAQALVMLNCGAGADNFSSGVYIGQRDAKGQWSFAPASFDYHAGGFSAGRNMALLVNARWDSSTQTITSHAKGRGIGDCGSSESWLWDGAAFRLTSATAMSECRGSLHWIPLWRAEVRFVG
jgi:hypothetical protein